MDDIYGYILTHELRLEQQLASFKISLPNVNMATRNYSNPGRGTCITGNYSCGSSSSSGRFRGSVRGGPLNAPNFAPSYNSSPRIFCQIYLKPSHTRPSCWRRFEKNYQPQPQQNSQAYVAAPQGPTDPTWYLDIGATNNNTSGLGNLNLNTEDYVGQDQVHMENGQGLNIHPIGSSILCSSSKSFFYITFFMSLI